jgi:hypothetical protein
LILNKIFIKNIVLAVLLLVLLAAIFMIRNRSPFGKNQSSFSIDPDRKITRIELMQDTKKVVLEQAGNDWKINRENEVRNSAISFILNVLEEMKIKSPVSPDIFEKEITVPGVMPVRVKVFENSRLLRSFFVYRTESNIYGNIMKLKTKAKPFIVNIPGFESDIGSAFNPDELYWQPYLVFNLLPSEITSVSLENFRDPGSSFKIINSAGKPELSSADVSLNRWDSLRVRRYLSYFTLIPFESWAPDLTEPEVLKIKANTPLYRITVMKTDGKEVSLSLWEKILNDGVTGDSDRLWATTGELDRLFIISYFDIDPLLKKKSYFFKE